MYTELRGQHLSQEKVGERHFALIQHTVPTEFPGRSYSAIAPGGKTSLPGLSCASLPQTHTCHRPHTATTLRCCNPDLWDKGRDLALRRAVQVVHALHLAVPSFTFPNAKLWALSPQLLAGFWGTRHPCFPHVSTCKPSFFRCWAFFHRSFIRSLWNTLSTTRRKRRGGKKICPC